jgi:DNA polymerase-1
MPYYKDDFKNWADNQATKSETLWSYNCKDCLVTYEIAKKQQLELKQDDLDSYFYGYKQPLFRVLFDMQTKGVKRDEAARQKHHDSILAKAEVEQQEINKIAGRELNVNSSKQMCQYLYTDLGLPVQYKKREKEGRAIQTPTSDEKALLKLFVRSQRPILKKIIELRGLLKSLSTYIDVDLRADGMIRTSYGVAETGRLTSSIPAWNDGMQVQNVPEELRDIFIPSSPELEITKADLSQAELRIVTYLADCKSFKEKFINHEDVMIMVASWITQRPESDFNKKSPERYTAKRTVHGLNYTMGP